MAFNSSDSDDSGSGRLRVYLVVIIVFLMTGWETLGEFNYLIFGQTTEPVFAEFYQKERTSDGEILGYKIEYSFDDPEPGTRTESDELSVSFLENDLPENFLIEFIPGSEHKSRIAGNRSYVMMGVFLCLFAVVVGFGIWLWRMAHNAVHSGPPSRRTPR